MNLEKEIIKVLEDGKEMTAYSIAKKIGVSWQTALIKLYMFETTGRVKSRKVDRFGRTVTYWSLSNKGKKREM